MAPATRRSAAFTLLEIMAVVAIFALLAGLALPNFSGLQARNLKNQAREVVAQLELARQRAIVTGVPHRFFIDVEGSAYRIEWLVTADAASGAPPERPDDDATAGGFDDEPIDLTAPREQERDYHPIAGLAGRFSNLDASMIFAGVETTGGWVEGGETFVRFERDGSADATTIVIEHDAGMAVSLEVLPLADTVRVRHETL